MVRSPIRYPGGKFKAMSQIFPLIPEDVEEWREPFFGGGSVTLYYLQNCKKKPKRLIVNDLAPEVYAFWQGVKTNVEGVIKEIEIMYNAYDDPRDKWKYVKHMDCTPLTIEQRAARFWICNKLSFSGTGDSGSLSMYQYERFKWESVYKLRDVSEVLQDVEIKNLDFEEIVLAPTDVDPSKVFIFLDPPYLTQEKSALYGRNGDTHKGFPHERHKEVCDKADAMGYKWLITLDDCPNVRRLYRDWNIQPFYIPYTMAITADNDALKGEELFITNMDVFNNDEEDAEFDDYEI